MRTRERNLSILAGVLLEIQTKVHPKVLNHGEGPFSWLKAATTAFTFKTLLRHYAKQVLSHGK